MILPRMVICAEAQVKKNIPVNERRKVFFVATDTTDYHRKIKI